MRIDAPGGGEIETTSTWWASLGLQRSIFVNGLWTSSTYTLQNLVSCQTFDRSNKIDNGGQCYQHVW